MLIHVIPRALVSRTPVLTYRTLESVVIGQLVQVPLRGRSIPGIVVKINVSADTTAPIQSISAAGSTVVPSSYIDSLSAIADYYGVGPAQVLSQLGAAITHPYLQSVIPTAAALQECIITPARTTPLAQALAASTVEVPDDAPQRRQQWQQAAAGQPLRLLGGTAALTLPFQSLRSIILDAPFASPYRSNRAPGFNTAVLSCLIAQATQATLTVRSPIPPALLRAIFPIPTTALFVQPKLQPITAVPLGTHGYLNTEVIETIREQLRSQKRVLVFINRLPKHNGQAWGIEKIVAELETHLNRPVALAHKGAAPTNAELIVATSHALYDHSLLWDYAVILSLEGLISPNQPHSPFAATEMIAALASRSPVYVQYRDAAQPLAIAVMNQLAPEFLQHLPLFSKRLVTARFPRLMKPVHTAYRIALDQMWPTSICDTDRTVCTYMTDRSFSIQQRELLHQRPSGVRLLTDDDSLPPLPTKNMPNS